MPKPVRRCPSNSSRPASPRWAIARTDFPDEVFMKRNWPVSIALVLASEGADVNRSPGEPSGISKYGVSLATYREYWIAMKLPPPLPTADTIASLTAAQASNFYRGHFADHIAFDDLPAGVDYRLFDITVNLGRGGGLTLLAQVLGFDAVWIKEKPRTVKDDLLP